MVKVSPSYQEFFRPVSTPMLILNSSCQIESLNDQAALLLRLKEKDVLELDEQSKKTWGRIIKQYEYKHIENFTLNVRIGDSFERVNFNCYYNSDNQFFYVTLKKSFEFSINVNKKFAQLYSMFKEFTHGIIISDLDGNIIDLNETALKMLERDKCELVNLPHENIFSNFANISLSKAKYFSELANNGQATIEILNESQGRMQFLKFESKMNYSLNILFTSITDETERYSLKQKVEEQKNLNTIGQMVASIAHEIRNPMTSLKGFIELLKLNTSEDGKKYLSIMNSELERMDSILSEVLYFSKPIEREKEMISISKLIDEVLVLMKQQTVNSNIEFVFSSVPNCRDIVLANAHRIKQMLINLVKNAIEVMDSGGTITISLVNVEDMLRIIVHDEGPGIDEDILSNLFKPFFTTKSFGTGLGLPLVKKVIEEHHGNIYVDSKAGSGTTFTIQLPVSQPTPLGTLSISGSYNESFLNNILK
nr:ATP-binding protein [Lysinibacillus timonensis]